jgi:hypothetical protein
MMMRTTNRDGETVKRTKKMKASQSRDALLPEQYVGVLKHLFPMRNLP